jgi:hypothetical protein
MGIGGATSPSHNSHGVHELRQGEPPHRADYILQRGVWHVTCRVCGWHAEGAVRRQLSSSFRFHLRTQRPPEPGAPPT